MLSKNKIKFIRSLQHKKYRQDTGCFAVEGEKGVLELAQSYYEVQAVYCTKEFLRQNRSLLERRKIPIEQCTNSELEASGAFETAHGAIAVARMQESSQPGPLQGLVLALDGVRDPGNFGALVRVADWFGIPTILASPDTTDFYNPKALQASMGSFCRVRALYVDLAQVLPGLNLPIYASAKGGRPAHDFPFEQNCVILLGNESHGISRALAAMAKGTIGIPAFGQAESLNVSIAAAIICDNYRRRTAGERIVGRP